MRLEHPDHFISVLRGYSFGNCKRAYYFRKAGLTLKEVGRKADPEPGSYNPAHVREMIKAFREALEFEAKVESRRKELVQNKVHFNERKMDSWENEIIVRASKTSNCWYGVLDSRGDKYCSLDFSTGAETREDAIRFTALKIRLDVLGIGKYAPHDQLKHIWDMAKFWEKKEIQRNYRQR